MCVQIWMGMVSFLSCEKNVFRKVPILVPLILAPGDRTMPLGKLFNYLNIQLPNCLII